MPRRVAADERAGLALPSNFAVVKPCWMCPWCPPLPWTPQPIMAPCPQPYSRMCPPHWTERGAGGTGAHSRGDWKTAVLWDPWEIQSYASGRGQCAGCQFGPSEAWNCLCLSACTRPIWAGPRSGSSGLLRNGWCWRWQWWGSAVNPPGFFQSWHHCRGSCWQCHCLGTSGPFLGSPLGPSRPPLSWKSCSSPGRLWGVHLCFHHRCPHRCHNNLSGQELRL